MSSASRSPPLAILIAHYRIDEAKVSVTYLGYDAMIFQRTAEELDSPNAVQPAASATDHPYILYVGARRGYKNFASLVTAFSKSRARKAGIRIVCVGGESRSAEEAAQLAELRIAPAEISQMSVSDRKLAELYRNALCLVCPSLYEGFGLPSLEAMACGCPVICSEVGSLPEVVGDAATLFDPIRNDDLTGLIDEVVFSPGRQDAMRSSGLDRARNFSWERCALQTIQGYDRLAAA